MEKEHWDIIIVGAGPTGLSTAIFGGRLGLRVLLIEQGSTIGPNAGGETLRYHPILDRLFGEGFLDKISLFRTWDTRIFSPGTKKLYLHHEKPGVNAFEWKDLMNEFEKVLNQTTVTLKVNTPVIGVIQNELGVAIGVECKSGEKCYGSTIIDASGAVNPLMYQLMPKSPNVGYPIVKSILSNYKDTFPGFTTFFLMKGSLDPFPDFPPITIFVFPHMNGCAEVGMMIFDNFAENHNSGLEDSEILQVWHYLCTNYPILSEMLKETSIEMERVTKIGSKQYLKDPMIIPGYLVIGAAGGFLEASHAAGLLTGMRAGEFWAEYLKKKAPITWNQELLEDANKTFRRTSLYKYVAKSHKKIKNLTRFLYGMLKTENGFHLIWPFFVYGKKKMG